jgi:hypothetical protein
VLLENPVLCVLAEKIASGSESELTLLIAEIRIVTDAVKEFILVRVHLLARDYFWYLQTNEINVVHACREIPSRLK